MQKSAIFTYMSNNQLEDIMYKKILLIIATTTATKIKCLGINLTRNVQNLYEENHKPFPEDIKVDLRK